MCITAASLRNESQSSTPQSKIETPPLHHMQYTAMMRMAAQVMSMKVGVDSTCSLTKVLIYMYVCRHTRTTKKNKQTNKQTNKPGLCIERGVRRGVCSLNTGVLPLKNKQKAGNINVGYTMILTVLFSAVLLEVLALRLQAWPAV